MKYIILILIFFVSLEGLIAQKYPLRVAILGNSIVRNGPNAAIGWNGDWGMAASAKEKDLVRLLEKDLKSVSTSIELQDLNISGFERDYKNYDFNNSGLNKIRDFSPDVLIIRIGENLDDWNLDVADFNRRLAELVSYVSNNSPIKIMVTNSFWSSYVRDGALYKFALDNKYDFADLNGLFDIQSNTAQGLFANAGVAKHPSDAGMQAIESRIWKPLNTMINDLICKFYQKCNYCQEGNFLGFLDKADCDTISGWVIDQNNLERLVEVEISIDNKPYINILANADRPDLQKTYGINGLKHGYKYAIPSGVSWKDGQNHTVSVKPCWKDAKPLSASGKTVNCPKPIPPKVYVPDYAAGWISTECDEIVGWAYDKNDLTKTIRVDFLLNDKLINSYQANLQRPELLTFITANPDAIKHIFVVSLPPLAKGNYTGSLRLSEANKVVGGTFTMLCPKLVLSTLEEEENKILVFPNPNRGNFRLILPKTLQDAAISVSDNLGRNVRIIRKNEEIEMENSTSGTYFLRISKGEKTFTQKIQIIE